MADEQLEKFEGVATIEKVAVALPPPRLRLPDVGHLRRPRLVLRLRPLRRPARAEHQGRVAALDDPGARRHGRARLGRDPQPAGLGRLRPRRRLLRPDGRLPHVQAALPRRPDRASALRQAPVEAPGRDARVRPDRAARLQPDVRDVRRRRCARTRARRLSAARDGAGHLRQLQERHLVAARQAAVRHRADRQELPQRDHARATSSSACASSSRWRWSSSSRRPTPTSGTATGSTSASNWYLDLGVRAVAPARARARGRRAVALLERDERHRVPLPDRLAGARGRREPRRLRPAPAQRGVRHEARVDRPRGALRPVRDRAGDRRRPRVPRVPVRRLRRGGRRRASAHAAAPAPAPRAGEGRRAAADRQGHGDGREGAPAVRGPAQVDVGRVRRRGGDRQALPPPGRDRHAVGADDRRADARGRHGHAARPRHARSRSGSRSTARSSCCSTGSSSRGTRARDARWAGTSTRSRRMRCAETRSATRTCGRCTSGRPTTRRAASRRST